LGVAKLRLEGIIAKRRDSTYETGKLSGAWQKFKINNEQEFVIGG
jgi:bifunctional non-homologous end joining protein LigD